MYSVCRFDITEVQLSLAGLQMLTAAVGPCLWDMMVNHLAAAAAWLTAVCFHSDYCAASIESYGDFKSSLLCIKVQLVK